jgi:hypothetical protein
MPRVKQKSKSITRKACFIWLQNKKPICRLAAARKLNAHHYLSTKTIKAKVAVAKIL